MLNFTLQSPPFSINKAHYKRSFTRTVECREWGDNILAQLQNPDLQLEFQEFRKSLNKREGIIISITYNIADNIFYTKKGEISRRSMDLSNIEKLLIDLIFDTRFCGREINGKVIHNLAIDDKLIVDMHSKKKPTEGEPYITIEIKHAPSA